jgi:hypothetical protein
VPGGQPLAAQRPHLVAFGEVVRHQLRLGALKRRLDRLQRGALGAGRFVCVLAVDVGLADVEAGLIARAGERGVGPSAIAGV